MWKVLKKKMNDKPWSTTSETYQKLRERTWETSTYTQRMLYYDFIVNKAEQAQQRKRLTMATKEFERTKNPRIRYTMQAAGLSIESFYAAWEEWKRDVEATFSESAPSA